MKINLGVLYITKGVAKSKHQYFVCEFGREGRGRFKKKLALSNYHGVHQEQQEVCGCVRELIQHRTNVNSKHVELNQREQQVSNRIIVLRHDLQEAEKELQTILADKETNTASEKDIESKINEEYSKGVNLISRCRSLKLNIILL